MTSSGRQSFLPITFDINELETWGWYHSVRLVKTHRLTCNMTYLGHNVTLTWRDLEIAAAYPIPFTTCHYLS